MQFMVLPTGLEVTSWLKMTQTLQGVFADTRFVCMSIAMWLVNWQVVGSRAEFVDLDSIGSAV